MRTKIMVGLGETTALRAQIRRVEYHELEKSRKLRKKPQGEKYYYKVTV